MHFHMFCSARWICFENAYTYLEKKSVVKVKKTENKYESIGFLSFGMKYQIPNLGLYIKLEVSNPTSSFSRMKKTYLHLSKNQISIDRFMDRHSIHHWQCKIEICKTYRPETAKTLFG